MSPAIPEHICSIWADTPKCAPTFPSLNEEIKTEVAIIGAGFTGLATAYHLRKAGIESVVLEANDIGWGASGRNGGMAVPRFKRGFAALAKHYGTATALHLHGMIHDAMDTLEATVKEFGIECGFIRCGHITAAHCRSALAALENDVRWLEREADDAIPQLLDRTAARDAIGSDIYVGGYLDPRGVGIHPLMYAQGLATALSRQGVPIYTASPVCNLFANSQPLIVETPSGRVLAEHVVFATNAYTDLMPAMGNLYRRIIPVNTSVISTAPLSPNVAAKVLPSGCLVSDTKHLMNYFRVLPGSRILFGGRGSITDTQSDETLLQLRTALQTTFPFLSHVKIDHKWSGKVAITLDHFPHLGRLDGNVWYSLGYGGRGVVLSNQLGKCLAQLIAGKSVDLGPMQSARFTPIYFHNWRIPAMHLIAGYYRLRDKLAS